VKVRTWIGPSRIAGKGVFAAQPIKKGTRILRYTGEKIPRAESDRRLAAGNVYIFGVDADYSIDGNSLKNTARYINHSCAPNCQTEQDNDTIWIVAITAIQAGEELTYNYGYIFDEQGNEPCHCGAPQCCGYILAPKYWRRIEWK
jgi:SET domain-containing protein